MNVYKGHEKVYPRFPSACVTWATVLLVATGSAVYLCWALSGMILGVAN